MPLMVWEASVPAARSSGVSACDCANVNCDKCEDPALWWAGQKAAGSVAVLLIEHRCP